MGPLLSISIPTYNRVLLLKKTLQPLLEQIDANSLHQEVEIVISDNCSTDATEHYINSLISLNSYRIIYNRNSQNLGVIKNILKLVEFSSGKYWMFYGDDDIIPGSQLAALVENFKENPQLGAFMFRWEENGFCHQLNDRTFLTPAELAKDFFYYIGNAGIFAVETSYAKQVIEQYNYDLVDTCWPQTMIIFMSMYSFSNPGILYRDLVASKTPEVPVIRSNCYYLFETALYALLRTAMNIEKQAKMPFVVIAKNSIDGIQHFKDHKEVIMENYLYYDSDKQKQDFVDSVKDAHEKIPFEHRSEIDFYYKVISSWRGIYIIKSYLTYLRSSLKRNINANFISKLKIYSPYGYYRSIMQTKKTLADLKLLLKREEVSAGSGYF